VVVNSSPPSLAGGAGASLDETVESELRASFLDALGEAVVATDPAGHIVYWNDAASRLLGWQADEVLGSRAEELVLAAGNARAAGVAVEHLRRHGSWSGEFMVRHRSDQVFPVHVTASTVRDEAGRTVALVGITRDVSTQRHAEETARQAQERLDLVHRAATSVIWEWEPGTGVVRRSEALGDMFGYAADAVEPTMDWWYERVHPDDRQRVEEGLSQIAAGERRFWTEEYRFRTAGDGYATVFDRAYVSEAGSGGPSRVVGTVVDLTERRRIHEEQRFLSQASMILDLSLDYESTIPTIARLAVNTVADCCILGVAGGDGFAPFVTAAHADPRLQPLVDELAGFLAAGPPAGPLLERVVRGGEAVLIRTVPAAGIAEVVPDPGLARRVTELRIRSVMVVPLSARRRALGYAIFATSTPERVYGEGELRTAEELGRRIGLTIDHARLFQSAELANRAKSDFLAVISHELRTPLTAVLGYADLLAEQVAGTLNEAQRRQVDRIRAGSDRLLRLIEGILAFARLETGRDRPHFEPVPLRTLLDHAEEMVRPTAAEKGVEFRLSVEGVPEILVTDKERVLQILLSLLTNAVKFSNDGAVEVVAGAEDGFLHVDVRDSGKGIAPEHLPHIFNPFWQAEQPATRRAGGAGLGLSIARRHARLLDGDVVVVDTSPTGTTFRLRLPVERSFPTAGSALA
jgi:PAS domain S-box-containing protein